MSIQQNINQLLTSSAYFAEPALEKRRELSNIRKNQDITKQSLLFSVKSGEDFTDTQRRDISQAEYGMAKRAFFIDPTQEHFVAYTKASKFAEEVEMKRKEEMRKQLVQRKKLQQLHENIRGGNN